VVALHGTSVGVFVKPGDFFKQWQRDHRQVIMRELKKRPDLSYLNNGKPVTMSTPMPDSELRPIVEQFLEHRLRAWDQFVRKAQDAFQAEKDAPELD
jgi:hypothetical protein